jgi:hypothetical protein
MKAHVFKTIGSQMVVRLSAPRASRPLPPWRFLVFISVRGWVDSRAIVRLKGLSQLKKSSDIIGIWTRDLPACSIVPQPTTLPRAPNLEMTGQYLQYELNRYEEAVSFSNAECWCNTSMWCRNNSQTPVQLFSAPICLHFFLNPATQAYPIYSPINECA